MRYLVSLFVIFAVTCLLVDMPWASAIDYAEAAAAVSDADDSLRKAFIAALDAESAGANVSSLMERMNQAGAALTEARVALAAGDYADAFNKAEECSDLIEVVSSEASALKSDAVVQASRQWETVLLSSVGSVVFVSVLFIVWRRFRRSYADKLLGSRPEAVA